MPASLKIPVGEILADRAPGELHPVSAVIPLTENLVGTLEGDIHLSRTAHDALIARGELAVKLKGECVRCLEPAELTKTLFLEQEFRVGRFVEDEEALPIENQKIDLTPALQRLALLAVPVTLLCQPNCQGLCPECGINRNQQNCQHVKS